MLEHDLRDVEKAIARACDSWGGSYNTFIPVDATPTVPPHWRDHFSNARCDYVNARDHIPLPVPPKLRDLSGLWQANWSGPSVLSVVSQSSLPASGYRTVQLANHIALDEPWGVAYNAVFGRWTDIFDAAYLEENRLDSSASYAKITSLKYLDPSTCGAENLVEELLLTDLTSARAFSCFHLNSFIVGNDLNRELNNPFPRKWQEARMAGPNLVVVYEPGSVQDLCLLWNLRAIYGSPLGLPLGIPASEDVASILKRWRQTLPMLRGRGQPVKAFAISASVSMDRLEAFCTDAGSDWSAAEWGAYLQPNLGCGIPSVESASFENGKAKIAILHPSEENVLGRDVILALGPSLDIMTRPIDQILPEFPVTIGSHLQVDIAGGIRQNFNASAGYIPIEWPSGWSMMESSIGRLKFQVEQSVPGKIASLMLKGCDRAGGMQYLLSDEILRFLLGLGTRRGFNESRRLMKLIVNEIDDGTDTSEQLARIESLLQRLLSDQLDTNRNFVKMSAIEKLFKNKRAAGAWVDFVQRAGLLEKGVRVQCRSCNNPIWLVLLNGANPVDCSTCGATIGDPFPHDQFVFSYCATDLLIRIVESDSMVHALTHRYLANCFATTTDSDKTVVGAYPGVIVKDESGGQHIGEVDLLLLMVDGSIGVGECKTSSAGLVPDELLKLDKLASVLGATWTFVSTLDRRAKCAPIWNANPTGGRLPHFSLTLEQLLDSNPRSLIGQSPLAPRTDLVKMGFVNLTDEQHQKEYEESLVALLHA